MPWVRSSSQLLPPTAPATKVPVLLIHGYCCNHGVWRDVEARLQALGHTVLAINLEPLFCSIDDYVPQVEQAVAQLRAQTERNDINYERTKRSFPPLPAPPEQLKASVTSFEKINARAVAPAALLAEVGQAMERATDFRLVRLDWHQGDTDPGEPANTGATPPPSPANTALPRFEWVTLYGMAGGNSGSADARVNTEIALRTAELLRAVRGSTVVIVRAPVDLTPGGRIAGSSPSESSNARNPLDNNANVEIRVARKVGS
jgi:hypothetical protein